MLIFHPFEPIFVKNRLYNHKKIIKRMFVDNIITRDKR